MKGIIRTTIAFSLVILLTAAGFLLRALDSSPDVYPGSDSVIRLYGEAHGYKGYYDAELALWKAEYDDGCRSLFLELPYYSAQFLNLWMQEDSDELLDRWFGEIGGTQSGNADYYAFFREIKAQCPQTVFYGTDVGHQYETTGYRYLAYLEDHGLGGSEDYRLTRECMRQGREFMESDTGHNGISPVRENYMVSNFIDAYTRCGGGRIMGIYGSYHTSLDIPDRMAGQLLAHYGDIFSSVRMSSILFSQKQQPYRPGVSITGIVFLVMLFTPNLLWARGRQPQDYGTAGKENAFLLACERIGEAAVSVALVIFPASDPCLLRLPEGVFFSWMLLLWVGALVLMLLYEGFWIRYFRSPRTMQDFYAAYAGFPVAGATLPVLAVVLLGLYSGNLLLLGAALLLGIGHIGIHLQHRREITAPRD